MHHVARFSGATLMRPAPSLSRHRMALTASSGRTWEDVLEELSSLITFKTRADGKGWRDAFENMPVYLQRLGLTDELSRLNVIHVAGTKGKGSTCAMVESILRRCGYRTGLFTSPHLCDVRERIRIDGQMVSRELFASVFWECRDRLHAAATAEVGMPGYFRYLTLLGLKMFLEQQVDVAILEVGIGGRLDATNIVPCPAACAITSLGFDHMELLGDTIELIAAEKAGILKRGSPAFTVQQPPGAMAVLLDKATAAGTTLTVPPPLSAFVSGSDAVLKPSLRGAHQELNASLAVALVGAWEQHVMAGGAGVRTMEGAAARVKQLEGLVLPEDYQRGLELTQWPGRSQVVQDAELSCGQAESRLTFYLDGAHNAVRTARAPGMPAEPSGTPGTTGQEGAAAASSVADAGAASAAPPREVQQVLLFNCTKERDPGALLPELQAALHARGVRVHHALFVRPDSQYGFLPSSSHGAATAAVDLSWQTQLRDKWASTHVPLPCTRQPGASQDASAGGGVTPLPPLPGMPDRHDSSVGAVVQSVGTALDWLRRCCHEQPQLQLNVLVTGSLYLVGDTLQALGHAPK